MIIDAALTPAEIDHLPEQDLSQTHCVVFDILRATSSIITGLSHGAEEIRPVLTIEEALEYRETQWPGAMLGGERFGNRIDGFDLGNSPQEYCRPGLRRIVTTTTNGTVALRACEEAREVWAGALLNMRALVDRVQRSGVERLLLVCAGTFRELALEDVFAAGMLASAFPDAALTDAAQVAFSTFRLYEGRELAALEAAKNGVALQAAGREDDVKWCAQISRFPVVGILRDGIIRKG